MLLVDEEELDVVVVVVLSSVELCNVESGMLLDPVKTNSRKLLPSVSPLYVVDATIGTEIFRELQK